MHIILRCKAKLGGVQASKSEELGAGVRRRLPRKSIANKVRQALLDGFGQRGSLAQIV
jgi:hypothetical protein